MSDIRIQDDLYLYVNKEKLDSLVIPDDKPRAGGFSELSDGVEELLLKDISEMAEKDEYPNEYLRYAGKLFLAVKDVKRRKREGIKPALKFLSKLEKLSGVSSLNRNLKNFILDGIALPFNVGVYTDMMDSSKHCLMLAGPSTILPDTTYYKEGMEQQKQQLLGLWSGMAAELLKRTKLSEEDQAKYIENALKFDAIIATLVKSQEEWSEYVKAYNPMKLSRVASMLKPIKFKKLVQDLFGFLPEQVIVADPRFLKGFKTLFNEENFELYKDWAYVSELISLTTYLSEELRELGGTYRRALSGLPKMTPLDKFAYQTASNMYSDPIGLYYGEKYFGEEAKKDIVSMVHDIIDRYKVRIKSSNVLAPETKEKAILKLDKMEVKMGYPDKVDEIYDKLVFEDGLSAFEIMRKLRRVHAEDNIADLSRPVDRTKWAMPGHMVNACYSPSENDITFPAAILQAPFYSIKQSRSQNLGGIGAVIGHEISHAFDNNGAQCDENGNIHNWWTKADYKTFNKLTKQMIEQFDGLELPWGKVNGSLVVSENIADNGGMAVTLDLMSTLDGANYEEYFKNWARVWCMKARPEFAALLLRVDVHSPAMLRANMQPRNFKEWYDTFKVTKKDKMYLPEKKRIIIW